MIRELVDVDKIEEQIQKITEALLNGDILTFKSDTDVTHKIYKSNEKNIYGEDVCIIENYLYGELFQTFKRSLKLEVLFLVKTLHKGLKWTNTNLRFPTMMVIK